MTGRLSVIAGCPALGSRAWSRRLALEGGRRVVGAAMAAAALAAAAGGLGDEAGDEELIVGAPGAGGRGAGQAVQLALSVEQGGFGALDADIRGHRLAHRRPDGLAAVVVAGIAPRRDLVRRRLHRRGR